MGSNEVPWKHARDFLRRMRERGWHTNGIEGQKPQASKFGNVATWVGEIRFSSKREAAA